MPANIDMIIDPQITSRLKDIGRLATLPQTTWELMRLLSDDRTTPDDLQRVVEQDPALSAKVISLSNSAYYGLRTPVTTISKAIMVIGFKELEFLSLGLGLAETFDLRKVPYGFDGEGLWLHSLAVSWTARELAAGGPGVDAGEAMLAGLLHNIGHIILVTHFTVQLQRLMDYVQTGVSLRQAEADLGLWHEAIGYILARNWLLPGMMQNVILYHHRPEIAPESQKLAALISLAIHLVGQTNFALAYEDFATDLVYLETATGVGEEKRQAILEKLTATLPLMVPAWLRMLGHGEKKRQKR